MKQMLKDRGHLVGETEINMTTEQFISKYGEKMKREDLVINIAKHSDDTGQAYLP